MAVQILVRNTPSALQCLSRRRPQLSTFRELNLAKGFLVDWQLKHALDHNMLIVPGTWSDSSIRHASYTLRLGDKVELALCSDSNQEERRDFVVHDLKHGDHLDLNPGDTAKLFSIEILDLPKDILAFTVARGLMFFEALVPENTYADPGFNGTLYTTVTNASNRVVRLHYGDPIARLFLYHLAEPVQEPFRKGTAKGIKQRLESFRATNVGTREECRGAKTEELIRELRHFPIAGNQLTELARRQSRRWMGTLAFSTVWPMLLLFANLNGWVKHTVGLVISNAAAVVLSAVISIIAPYIWGKLKTI